MSENNSQKKINEGLAAGLIGINALSGLAGSSPIEKYNNEVQPESSYSQQVDNPNVYPKLSYGSSLEDQLEETVPDPKERSQENKEQIDKATDAKNQPTISGPPVPDPPTEATTSSEEQNSNSELADQLRNSWTTSPGINPAYEVRTTEEPQDSNVALAEQLSNSSSDSSGDSGDSYSDSGSSSSSGDGAGSSDSGGGGDGDGSYS